MGTLKGTGLVLAVVLGLTLSSGCSSGGGGGGDDDKDPPLVPVAITTVPAGLKVVVDGTEYTSPATMEWPKGQTHQIGVPSPQTSGPDTYVWSSWSDAGAQTHNIVVPSSAVTYTATFVLQGANSTRSHVFDSGGGEAGGLAHPNHTTVHASVGQGAAHVASDSAAGNGVTVCEAGFIGSTVTAEIGSPVTTSVPDVPEQF